MDETKVKQNMLKLHSNLTTRESKYIRNMNRYFNNGVRREDLWTPYTYPQGYVVPAQNADGVQTQINVIKSIVDTITSKISQANVRPFFNSINGLYDTVKTCLDLQNHFDVWLDEQHAYPKSVLCFRDAAIFDIGVMLIDPETQSLNRIPPWEYFIDPAEYMHGSITHMMHWTKYFPLASIADRIDNKVIRGRLKDNPQVQDEHAVYWDLYGGEKWEFFGKDQVCDPIKLDYEQYGGLYRRPTVEIYYNKPLKGFFSTSLADEEYPIQRNIDELVRRIDSATRKMPLGMIFTPEGSNIKASSIENGVAVYTYRNEQASGGVSTMTPNPIHSEWIDLLNFYINKAYDLAGVSQLSAQARAPSNLDSGKALDTMEDIESDRFNVQLQQFTHFLVDVSRVCIDTFPGKLPILPARSGKNRVTWGDARKNRARYSIQFSAASALSKDPEEKMNQIEMMLSAGFIDKDMATHFMQLPDLENVYTSVSASYDAVQEIVERAIEDGEVDYPETVDMMMLKKEIVKRLNRLEANDDDEKYIKNLYRLLERVITDLESVAAANATPAQKPVEPQRDQAFDSGQITSLISLAEKVQSGALTVSVAIGIAASAYPNIPMEILKQMFVAPVAPAVQGAEAAPVPSAPVNNIPQMGALGNG